MGLIQLAGRIILPEEIEQSDIERLLAAASKGRCLSQCGWGLWVEQIIKRKNLPKELRRDVLLAVLATHIGYRESWRVQVRSEALTHLGGDRNLWQPSLLHPSRRVREMAIALLGSAYQTLDS